jgi:predicted metal-dependent hydrolase
MLEVVHDPILDEMGIKVLVRRSPKREKTIALSWDSKIGGVIVTAPPRLYLKRITEMVVDKRPWIIEKHKEFSVRKNDLYVLGVKKGVIPDDIVERTKLKGELKEFALDHFQNRVEYFAKLMGLKFARVSLGRATRRWGSCSHRGHIIFNWKAIMTPTQCVDYLVVHELAHIPHPDHSDAFWNKVEKTYPHYKESNKELQTYAFLLTMSF